MLGLLLSASEGECAPFYALDGPAANTVQGVKQYMKVTKAKLAMLAGAILCATSSALAQYTVDGYT